MPIIAGLGNIGSQYEGTRHNIGFRIVYTLAEKHGINFKSGRGSYYVGNGLVRNKSTYLILPTTFMNRSGDALQHALHYYKQEVESMIVCTDDINLATGKLRLRTSGGAGGHNGLSDIIYKLGTDQFPRLRFGVGSNFGRGNQADYVLTKFFSEEIESVNTAVDRAVLAIEAFLLEGIEASMNQFN